MNFLDIRTVLVGSIISGFICMAVMVSLWRQNRRHSPELVFWLMDFVMQFTAILLISLRGILPDFISMVVGNTLVVGGALLLLIGLERYLKKPSWQLPNYLYLAIFVLAHTYFAFVQPSLPARNINLSLGLLVVCSQCAWLLLHRADSAQRPDARPVGVIFTAYSLVSLVRIFVDLMLPHENDLFKSGLYDVLAVLIYQMLFISLTFALFLMVNRRLFTELENDISDRKLAEEALKISEEKFSKSFQTSPYAIIISRAEDGKFLEVNDAFTTITGIPRAKVLESTTLGLNLWVNNEDRQSVVAALRAGQSVAGQEFLFRKNNGEVITGLFSAQMIQLNQEPCILSSINDITERKQAEEELKINETRYHKAQTLGQVGNWEYNLETTHFWGSEETKRIYGFESDSREFTTDQVENCILERERVHQALIDLIEKETTYDLEFEIITKDQGESRIIRSIAVLEKDAGGQPLKITGVIQDITQRKQAQEALSQSEERYRLLAENAADVLWVLDAESQTFRYASPAVERVLGFTDQEFINRSVAQVVTPASLEFIQLTTPIRIERMLQGHLDFYSDEIEVIHKDGHIVVTEINMRFLVNQMTGLIEGMGVMRDITERKQAEAALKESEDRWKRAVAESPIPIMIHDEDDRVLQLSAGWTKFSGYDLADHPTLADWTERAYGERSGSKKEYIDQLFSINQTVQNGEWVITTKDGSKRIWEFQTTPLGKDLGGKRILHSLAIDITERKQAEAALRESQAMLRYVLDTTPQSIFWKDIHGVYLGCNLVFARVAGFNRPEEIVGKTDFDLPWPREEAEAYRVDDQDVISKQTPKLHIIEQVQQANGRRVWADTSKLPLLNDQGQAYGVLGVFEDITERKQMEANLRESQSILQAAMDQSSAGIAIAEAPDGKLRYVNDAGLLIRGSDRQTSVDEIGIEQYVASWQLFDLDGKPLESTEVPLARAILFGETCSREFIVRRASDDDRIVLGNAAPILNEAGEVVAGIVVFSDITASKQAENLLQQQNKYLLALQETALELVSQLDLVLLLENIVRRAGQLLETESGYLDLVDAQTDHLLPKIGLGALSESLQHPSKPGEGVAGTVWQTGEPLVVNDYDHWSGRIGSFTRGVLAAVIGVPLLSSGRVLGVLGLGYEFSTQRAFEPEAVEILTQFARLAALAIENARLFAAAQRELAERKRAETELMERHATLSAILESANTPVFSLDRDYRYTSFNSAHAAVMKALYGVEIELGHNMLEYQSLAKDQEDARTNLDRALGGEQVIESAYSGEPGRNRRFFEVSHNPIRDRAGEVIGVAVFVSDITERKQAEEALLEYSTRLEADVAERTRELREAQEQLVRQERLATLGQLAGSIGHELRNPLGVISNALYYLKLAQPEASDKVREYLDIIEKEIQTSNKIVTDLLDFTRIKSINRQAASVSQLVQQTLERFPVPSAVSVVLKIAPDLPQFYADPQQVVQILGNLVTNACQSMVSTSSTAEPSITSASALVETNLMISSAVAGEVIKIVVQDTGPGILPENIDKIFQPLFTTKMKGIGLGLAVSKKLAEANGGRIEVESEIGKGSTFSVYLPTYRQENQ